MVSALSPQQLSLFGPSRTLVVDVGYYLLVVVVIDHYVRLPLEQAAPEDLCLVAGSLA